MAHLVDSSVFIALERQGLRLGVLGRTMPDEPIAIASITASELLTGVQRADSPARRSRREAFVEAILEAMPVLAFDLRAARIHAQVLAQLVAAGHPIGAHDLLIASTALAHGYAVLTHHLREFRRVPGLVVRQPAW